MNRRRTAVHTALVAAAMALAASPVAAAPPDTNFTVEPFSETITSCSGESVDTVGTIRHHVVFVADATGGFHGNGIFQIIAKGTSASGTRYVANSTATLSQYFAADEIPSEGTAPFAYHLISNDGSPNLQVRDWFHITVNATGEVSVFRSGLEVVCSGEAAS